MTYPPIRFARILAATLLALAMTACNTLPPPRPIATWAPTFVASPTVTPGTPEPTATATPKPTVTASPTPPPTATPTPTPTPFPLPSAKGEAGWTTYTGPGQAFSITLPASWQPAFVDPRTVQTMITALTGAQPELVTLLTLMLSGSAFAAVDPTAAPAAAGAGIPTGVMVLKQPKGMIRTAAMLAPLLFSAAQLAEGIKKPVERRKVQLSAGEAEEIVWRMEVPAGTAAGAPVEIVQTIYPLEDEDNLYLVIFTSPAGVWEAQAPTFYRIAESFTFISR